MERRDDVSDPSFRAPPAGASLVGGRALASGAGPCGIRVGTFRISRGLTHLGQLIEHDIPANTDREVALSVIDGAIVPLDRATGTEGLGNLRDGSAGLDGLYEDTAGQGPFAVCHEILAGKMWLATPEPDGLRVPLPALPDNAPDLLRRSRMIDRGEVTLAEFQALDEPLAPPSSTAGSPSSPARSLATGATRGTWWWSGATCRSSASTTNSTPLRAASRRHAARPAGDASGS